MLSSSYFAENRCLSKYIIKINRGRRPTEVKYKTVSLSKDIHFKSCYARKLFPSTNYGKRQSPRFNTETLLIVW